MTTTEITSKIEAFENVLRIANSFSKKLVTLELLSNPKNARLFLLESYTQRFIYFTETLLVLAPKLKEDKLYKSPMGIIARTCMSDVISYHFFFNMLNKKDGIREVKKLLGANLNHSIQYFEKQRSKSKISKEEYNEVLTLLNKLYPEYFTKNNVIIDTENIQISERAKKLDIEVVKLAYENYYLLSKFEHVGILTFDLETSSESFENYFLEGFIGSSGIYIRSLLDFVSDLDLNEEMKNEYLTLDRTVKKYLP